MARQPTGRPTGRPTVDPVMDDWQAWLGWTAYRRTRSDTHRPAYLQHERTRKRLKAATGVGSPRTPAGAQ